MNCGLFHPYNATFYPHSNRFNYLNLQYLVLLKDQVLFLVIDPWCLSNWSVRKSKSINLLHFPNLLNVSCQIGCRVQPDIWPLHQYHIRFYLIKNKKIIQLCVLLLWTVCLIVRSTLTFGSFAKYSANLITSERASVTWNKLETFLTNNTITETLNKKSFSRNITWRYR